MHVAAKIGLATAGLAIGGAAGGLMVPLLRDRTREAQVERREVLETATSEWQAWKAKADEAFPDRKLDTPADHARFEQFLATTPPPAWASVAHEEFTRYRVTASSPLAQDQYPVESQKATGYGVMSGLLSVGLGGAGVHAALRGSFSTLPTVGLALGGGALAAFGAGMAVASVLGHDNEAGIRAIREFVGSVNDGG